MSEEVEKVDKVLRLNRGARHRRVGAMLGGDRHRTLRAHVVAHTQLVVASSLFVISGGAIACLVDGGDAASERESALH